MDWMKNRGTDSRGSRPQWARAVARRGWSGLAAVLLALGFGAHPAAGVEVVAGNLYYYVIVDFSDFAFLDNIDCASHPCQGPNKNGEPYVKIKYVGLDGYDAEWSEECADQSVESGSCGAWAYLYVLGTETHVTFEVEMWDDDTDEYGSGVGIDDPVDISGKIGDRVVTISIDSQNRWTADGGINGSCEDQGGFCALNGHLDGSAGYDEDDGSIRIHAYVYCSEQNFYYRGICSNIQQQ